MRALRLNNAKRFSTSHTVILHYWNQGYRNATEISRLTQIAELTVRYSIAKIKEQGSVGRRRGDDPPRKIGANSNIAMVSSKQRDHGTRNRWKTTARTKSEHVSVDSPTSATATRLQECFTSSNTNGNRFTERGTCSVVTPAPER